MFAPEKYDDVELIMYYEQFVTLLYKISSVRDELAKSTFPRYKSKDGKTLPLLNFDKMLKELHRLWEANIPLDPKKLAELHNALGLAKEEKDVGLETATKFCTAFILAQYELLKKELEARHLLICKYLVGKFVIRPKDQLQHMIVECDNLITNPAELDKLLSVYFEPEDHVDCKGVRDVLGTMCNYLLCQHSDRPDQIFDEVFQLIDTDKDGKATKADVMRYAGEVAKALKGKLTELMGAK